MRGARYQAPWKGESGTSRGCRASAREEYRTVALISGRRVSSVMVGMLVTVGSGPIHRRTLHQQRDAEKGRHRRHTERRSCDEPERSIGSGDCWSCSFASTHGCEHTGDLVPGACSEAMRRRELPQHVAGSSSVILIGCPCSDYRGVVLRAELGAPMSSATPSTTRAIRSQPRSSSFIVHFLIRGVILGRS